MARLLMLTDYKKQVNSLMKEMGMGQAAGRHTLFSFLMERQLMAIVAIQLPRN